MEGTKPLSFLLSSEGASHMKGVIEMTAHLQRRKKRSTKKTKCLVWSKGRTRCLKRAKR